MGAGATEVAGEDVGTGLASAKGRMRRSKGAIIFIVGERVRLV